MPFFPPILPGGPTGPPPDIFDDKDKKQTSTPTQPTPKRKRQAVVKTLRETVPNFETDYAVYYIRPAKGMDEDSLVTLMDSVDAVFCVEDTPSKYFETLKKYPVKNYELIKKKRVEVWFREGKILVATEKGERDDFPLFLYLGLVAGGGFKLREGITRRDLDKIGAMFFGVAVLNVPSNKLLRELSKIRKEDESKVAYLPLKQTIPQLYLNVIILTLDRYVRMRFKDEKPKDGKKPKIYLLLGDILNDVPVEDIAKYAAPLKEYKEQLDARLKSVAEDRRLTKDLDEVKVWFDTFYKQRMHRYKFSDSGILSGENWDEEVTDVTIIDGNPPHIKRR